MQNSRL
ncbi:aldehyde dehydrogenase family protein, partial [Vibrio parahaemolyticus V-223/04]